MTTIKRTTFFFVVGLISLIVSSGCGDFDRRTQFNTTYANRITLDSGNTKPGSEMEAKSDTLIVDFIGTVKDHSSSESSIESVVISGLSIEVDPFKSDKSENLGFLESMEIYLKGKDVDEVLLAKTDSVPSYRYFEIQVIPEGEDFTDLIKTEEFTCRMVYTTKRQLTDSAVVVKITPEYLIDTRVFGI